MKSPAFQFYADDFLAGTVTMSNEERGLYITLLCIQWTKGSILQEDVDRLSTAMAQLSLSHVLSKFRLHKNGARINQRLEHERKKQKAYRINRSISGKYGAEKRWHSHSTAIAQPMAKHSSPSPSPIYNICTRFKKPELGELKLAMAKAGLPETEAQHFLNYYESNGWKVGRNPMKSWPHAVGNWAMNYRRSNAKHAATNVNRNQGTFNETRANEPVSSKIR